MCLIIISCKKPNVKPKFGFLRKVSDQTCKPSSVVYRNLSWQTVAYLLPATCQDRRTNDNILVGVASDRVYIAVCSRIRW